MQHDSLASSDPSLGEAHRVSAPSVPEADTRSKPDQPYRVAQSVPSRLQNIAASADSQRLSGPWVEAPQGPNAEGLFVILYGDKPIGQGAVSKVYAGEINTRDQRAKLPVVARSKVDEQAAREEHNLIRYARHMINKSDSSKRPDGSRALDAMPLSLGVMEDDIAGEHRFINIHRHEGDSLAKFAHTHRNPTTRRLTDSGMAQVFEASANVAWTGKIMAEGNLTMTDLKPDNIAMGDERKGVIIDLAMNKVGNRKAGQKFGSSRLLSAFKGQKDGVEYSIGYAAPELVGYGGGMIQAKRQHGEEQVNVDAIPPTEVADKITAYGIGQTIAATLLKKTSRHAAIVQPEEQKIKAAWNRYRDRTQNLDNLSADKRLPKVNRSELKRQEQEFRMVYHYGGGADAVNAITSPEELTERRRSLGRTRLTRTSAGKTRVESGVKAPSNHDTCLVIAREYGNEVANMVYRATHPDLRVRSSCEELYHGLKKLSHMKSVNHLMDERQEPKAVGQPRYSVARPV